MEDRPKYQCKKCGHVWRRRHGMEKQLKLNPDWKPKACPACKRYDYWKPKKTG